MALGSVELPAIVQKVFLDTSGVDKGAAGAESRVSSMASKMGSVGSALTKTVTLPIAAVGVAAFKMASDLNESISKVSVVFGNNAKDIQAWSKTAATSMGMSQQQALEAAGTFGNLFRAMNLGIPEATKMSKSIVGLSADLASFNNANPEDVLLALHAGLVGETEPLRKFGVNINQARIEAEAFALGLAQPIKNAPLIQKAHLAVEAATKRLADAQKEHGKGSLEARQAANDLTLAQDKLNAATAGAAPELNAAQKAQAAYSLIMKDTKLAQGDFARTSEGAANQQRILVAQFKDTAATLGQGLLPIGTKVLGFFNGLLSSFRNLSPEGQGFVMKIIGVVAALGPVLLIGSKVLKFFTAYRTASAAVAAGNATLGQSFFAAMLPVTLIVAAIAAVGVALYVAYQKVDWFRSAVDTAWQALQTAWDVVWGAIKVGLDFFGNHWRTIVSLVLPGVGLLIAHFDTFKGVAVAVWNAVSTAISFVWTSIIQPAWAAISFGIDNLVAIFQHWLNIATTVWNAIGTAISWVWTTILQPVWNAIVAFVTGYLTVTFQAFKAAFEVVWNAVGWVVKNIWEGTLSPVWNTIVGFVTGTLSPVWDGLRAAFEKAWGAIGSFASGIWGTIKSTFQSGLRFVGDIVGRMLQIAAGIAKVVGAGPLSASLSSAAQSAFGWGEGGGSSNSGGASGGVKYMARGGQIPAMEVGGGFITEGARAIVGEGRSAYPEFVIPTDPQFRKRAQGLAMEAAERVGLYAKGGRIPHTGGLWDIGKAVVSNLVPGGHLLVKGVEQLTVAALKAFPIPTRTDTAEIALSAARKLRDALVDKLQPLEAPPLGPGIGWEAMWKAVKAKFPTATLHSGFRPGAITATGKASYHGKGRAIDVSPWASIGEWIRQNYMGQTKEMIFSPMGGRQIHNGSDHYYTGVTRANHWDHVHWAMARGGRIPAKSYDQGGWLNPGWNLAYNGTGRPEKVTPSFGGGGVIAPTKAERRAWFGGRKDDEWSFGQWRHEASLAAGSQRRVADDEGEARHGHNHWDWRDRSWRDGAMGRLRDGAPSRVGSGGGGTQVIEKGAFSFNPVVGDRVTPEDLRRLRGEMEAALEAFIRSRRMRTRRG